MPKYTKEMWTKWRNFRLSEGKIKMGFAGYDNYFKTIESAMDRVDRNMKTLMKDLAKDKDADYKRQVLELQRFYKKYVIEMKVKLADWKRKNT